MQTTDEDIGGLVHETRDLVEEYVKPTITMVTDSITGTTAPAYIDKDGVYAVPADVFGDYLTKPRFRHGVATLTALDSFIFHANRFKSDSSAVFACDDRTNPSLTSVLDYHPEGADSEPAFRQHRGVFKFPLSDEWKAWHASNGPDHAMNQVEFAQFLEDRIVDVEHPSDVSLTDDTIGGFVDKLGGLNKIASPTKLLEMAAGLTINEQSVVGQQTRLASGEVQIMFQNEHVDANGLAVDIPTMFVLAIPVFRNGGFYRVLARLRYRTTGGALRFWYELWRTDRVFDHAFDEACAKVNAETGLPVLKGSPE